MKTKIVRLIVLASVLFAGSIVKSAEPPKAAEQTASKLLTAIEKSDYDAFVADGEATFKQLKKEQFEAVAAQAGPKLKTGYQISYLGDLKQHGYQVTLWKISFKDGSDDGLALLSVKDGKVGGFFIR